MKRYAYSYDREDYSGSFASPEDAVAAAVNASEGLSSPPTTIYVGTVVDADPQAGDHARQIVDAMNRRAHVDYGEPAMRYLRSVTTKQVMDLDKLIEQAIRGWLQKNNLMPTFVKVTDIREYPVPYPAFIQSLRSEASEVQDIGVSESPADVG
jgi:hypothetical protein